MWTSIAIIAGSFVVCVLVILVLEWRRLRRVEAKFFAQRIATTDDEFVQAFATEKLPRGQLLRARNVMAELCGVQPDLISPNDTIRSLLELQFDNGWIEDFVWGFDSDLDIERVVGQTKLDWSFQQFVVFVMGQTSGRS